MTRSIGGASSVDATGTAMRLRNKMEQINGLCYVCRNHLPIEETEAFEIDDKTCAIYKAITLGKALVIMCKDCIKEKGKPTERYLGRVRYEKDGRGGLFD